MDILLLTEANFKKIVPISKNVDITTSITQSITTAQISYIKNLFCEEMWTEIQAQSNPGPPNAVYQALLDQITPTLAWYSYYIMLIYSTYKTREVGTVQQVSDKAQVIDNSSLAYVRDASMSTAQTYQQQLVKYINKNWDTFGVQCSCICDTPNEARITHKYFINI